MNRECDQLHIRIDMVNAVKVFTLRLCISAYYIHFKRVKVKIFTAFTIVFSKASS